MSFCEIRLPKDADLGRWAAPLTPLAMAFASLADHANTDAAPEAPEAMRIVDPQPDETETPT
ncbi:hypothetical protein [uncultured Roseobacter sp.]|uniref:hypothetical protein n=1 Tax=uncultured Roseobacter sp. TaxID=114847 RepID=UPI002612BF6C|nr:hypothetical protein [uncultured Roseobacter sp.]